MRTVTVLGAAGFLGSALLASLCGRQIRLRAVARQEIAVPDAVADVSTHVVDVTDRDALTAAVAGSDVVFNVLKHSGDWRAAGTDPGAEAVNVGAMRTVVDALKPDALCVFAGAVGQVGVPPAAPLDGTEPDHPHTGYDRQKLAAERVLLDAPVRGVSLRLPTVFGQRPGGRRDVGVVVTMARRAFAGDPLTIWGDGDVKRDLIHVDDVVAAFLAAMDNPDELVGRHWVVGTGEVWSLAEVFRAVAGSVAAHTGAPPVPVVSVPAPPHAVAGDAHSVRVDPVPFQRAAGWTPAVPPWTGIDRTVAVLAAELTRTEQGS